MTPTKKPHILIVDDHDMLRCGLGMFVQTCTDFELVGEARNGIEAVELCECVHPDIVLMDLMMPQMDGVTATRLIRQRFPDIRVIALSGFVEEKLVSAALAAGAVSYLLKNVTVDSLVAAIRDAYDGKATLAPEAVQALVTAAHRPRIPASPLSRREREVLGLIAQGCSNAEIGAELKVGISTVKKHVSSILNKLQIGSRSEAAALAVRHHLVDD